MNVSPSLPDMLFLDADRVRQVLLNLVGNAVKFSKQGAVTVSLDYADGALVCTVHDTGPGIPDAKIGQLFQRFSQVDGSMARPHGGTGLGLAICKGLVEAMGGEIDVESAEGKGSTFTFHLPAPLADGEIAGPQPDGTEDLSGLRVLGVDDNPESIALLEDALRPLGVLLETAASGAEAIALARAQPFDVILMDLHMPQMSGGDAAARIRAGGLNVKTPIFAFTADALRGLKDDKNAKMFDGVMLKPLSLATLRRTLRQTAKAA
jgi:CheY-like chemotaxis protein